MRLRASSTSLSPINRSRDVSPLADLTVIFDPCCCYVAGTHWCFSPELWQPVARELYAGLQAVLGAARTLPAYRGHAYATTVRTLALPPRLSSGSTSWVGSSAGRTGWRQRVAAHGSRPTSLHSGGATGGQIRGTGVRRPAATGKAAPQRGAPIPSRGRGRATPRGRGEG